MAINMSGLTGARVNGLYYDHTSIEFSIDGVIQPNVTDINYSASMDPGMFRGTSAKPVGRTRGTIEYEADFTIYTEDFEAIKAALDARPNSGGFMLESFTITVNHREEGANIPITDVVIGARIVGVDKSSSEGSDPLVVKVNLSVMDVLFNTHDPVKRTAARVGGLIAP